MLAIASRLETRSTPCSVKSRQVLSPGAAALAGALVLLLIAAAAIAVFMLIGEGVSPSLQVLQLGWIAGLLAAALLLAAVLAKLWARREFRERRASEAQARKHVLELSVQKQAAQADGLAKTRFIAQMSHELRTPLNAIVGFAQLLANRPEPEPCKTQKAWVEGMAEAAWHLQALMQDLNDLNGIEAGQPQVHRQATAIEPLIAETLRMAQAQAEHAGIRLAPVSRATPALTAHADPLRLRQVLLNLLTNAIKYGRRGGHVRVEVQSTPDELHLQVIDNGIGMDRSQLAHLFEPFNRLGREASAVSGSGIGLALVRQWVRMMDGDIRVESQVGIGTTVHVRLPARPDPVEQIPSEATTGVSA